MKIDNISLENTKNLGHIYLNWTTSKISILKNPNNKNTLAKQLNMLKENYHNIGEYAWEDDVFYEYMRQKRKQKIKDQLSSEAGQLKKGALTLQHGINKLFLWIIEKIGAYGTKPSRVALTMIVTWVIFGIIFSFLLTLGNMGGIAVGCEPLSLWHLTTWVDGFYFSAITFLTMAYGEIYPDTILIKLLALSWSSKIVTPTLKNNLSTSLLKWSQSIIG